MFQFFFNDTATTEIYTLSLHDALPIFKGYFKWLESRAYKMHVRVLLSRYRAYLTCPDCRGARFKPATLLFKAAAPDGTLTNLDRKSTRLNSSHANISYAVFCLKKKHSS